MIPEFTADGFLPEGIHRATVSEFEERFVKSTGLFARRTVFDHLRELLKEAADSGIVKRVLVGGSFVTANPAPNDFDCLIALDETVIGRELRPFEYRIVSRRRARKAFQGDVFAFPADSPAYREYFEFFQKTRDGSRVGILEIEP